MNQIAYGSSKRPSGAEKEKRLAIYDIMIKCLVTPALGAEARTLASRGGMVGLKEFLPGLESSRYAAWTAALASSLFAILISIHEQRKNISLSAGIPNSRTLKTSVE